MKNPKLSHLCVLLLLFIFSCKEKTEIFENIDQAKININKVKVAEDQKLESLLEQLYQPNSRSQFLFQGSHAAIDLDSALKIEIPEKDITRYSLILDTEFSGDFSFSNLILTDDAGAYKYMIMQYFPEDDWLLSQ